MTISKQQSGVSINEFCATIIGGAVMSVFVLGNQSIVVDSNYDNPTQVVRYDNDQTNIYKTFTPNYCITQNIPGYSVNEINNSGVGIILINEEKLENLKKLDIIASLDNDWNGNGAKSFGSNLIAKVRNIITFLDIQPEVFPTACDSIQLEYDKPDGAHMEIEINNTNDAEIFVVDSVGNERIANIQATINEINEVVNAFYG